MRKLLVSVLLLVPGLARAASPPREEAASPLEVAAIAHLDEETARLNKLAEEIYGDIAARHHLAPGERFALDRARKVVVVFAASEPEKRTDLGGSNFSSACAAPITSADVAAPSSSTGSKP